MKNWDSKEVHQKLVTTLGADADGRSRIKIWLQKFRNNDLFTIRLSALRAVAGRLWKRLLDLFFLLQISL
jgi:hypothetical protein